VRRAFALCAALARSAPVCFALGGSAALSLALACSGPLEGERATEPVADWALVAGAEDLAFATASGRRFRAVRPATLVHGGALYLHVSTVFPWGDEALDELRRSGRLTLRARGRLHELSATELTTPEAIDPLLPTLVRRGFAIEATGLHWDPSPARYPGTQVRQWFFRLEPAGG
jgi:hypothetical protein